MQATLCLRTACPTARNQHCHPLTFHQAISVLLRRHCQLALNFSPLIRNSLSASPSRNLANVTVVRAHKTAGEDDIDKKNKIEEARRCTAKLAAAAVVLACTIGGAMGVSWNSRACAWSILPWTTEQRIEKSKTQLEILDLNEEELRELKEHLDPRAKRAEVINSLRAEWDNMQRNAKQPQEEYNLGLILIDLYINEGNYKEAEDVRVKIERNAPPSDSRPKIHKVTIEMMSLLDRIQSETNEKQKTKLKREAESKAREIIQIIKKAREQSIDTSHPPC